MIQKWKVITTPIRRRIIFSVWYIKSITKHSNQFKAELIKKIKSPVGYVSCHWTLLCLNAFIIKGPYGHSSYRSLRNARSAQVPVIRPDNFVIRIKCYMLEIWEVTSWHMCFHIISNLYTVYIPPYFFTFHWELFDLCKYRDAISSRFPKMT